MIGDRNLFAVELSAPRVLAAARELDAASARYADAPETLDGLRRQIDEAIGRLETARNKIAASAGILNVIVSTNVSGSTLGEPQTRLDATLAVVEAIDAFVGGTVPRMEARIAAASPTEALALARRLRDAAVRILAAAGDFAPLTDLLADVKTLAAGIVKSAGEVADDAGSDVTAILGIVAFIAVVLLARDLVR